MKNKKRTAFDILNEATERIKKTIPGYDPNFLFRQQDKVTSTNELFKKGDKLTPEDEAAFLEGFNSIYEDDTPGVPSASNKNTVNTVKTSNARDMASGSAQNTPSLWGKSEPPKKEDKLTPEDRTAFLEGFNSIYQDDESSAHSANIQAAVNSIKNQKFGDALRQLMDSAYDLKSTNNIMYVKKQKPNYGGNPNKRKGSEGRQPSGERERNVGHPDGEEHNRVAKGTGGRGVVRRSVTEETKKAVVGGVAMAGTGYLIWRGVRLLPSLLPQLWWTIPANLATP